MSDDWFRYAAATLILAWFALAIILAVLAFLIDLVKRWYRSWFK